jgi:Flp pilus assembly pilin Flp
MTWFMVRTWATRRFAGERGASLVEYLLLLSLIAIAVMAAVLFLGGELGNSFNDAGSGVSNLTP